MIKINSLIFLIPFIGFFSLLYAVKKILWILKQDEGNSKMKEISSYIENGAKSFLKAEYKVFVYFIFIFSIGLFLLSYIDKHTSPLIVLSFITGSFFSAFAGFIGMRVSTKANVRTTQAARNSLKNAFDIAFSGGVVMGISVTSIAIFGLSILLIFFLFLFFPNSFNYNNKNNLLFVVELLTGFSFGAEAIALFSRVGGGIYTKAADIGADLVGKIEQDIPEDDVRNPAVIADNVGDNVGDIAGMGADLFGSFIATILAAMVLGCEIDTINIDNFEGVSAVLLPLFMCSFGILISIFSNFFIKINKNNNIYYMLNKGNFICIILNFIFSFFLIKFLLPNNLSIRNYYFTSQDVFYSASIGLLIGFLISIITEYFTSTERYPVNFIIKQSLTGHATNIIAGLSIGMFSTALPVILFSIGIFLSFYFSGFYGVAMSSVGMMTTTAMQLSIDAFGPIADNAGGIAEMSNLNKEVRERTDILDSVGNTTAATGKGFAIASAALTSLALFAAFIKITGIKGINIYNPLVLSGLFLGSMIPFLFSALTINAVGLAAMKMVNEVRRQFREIPGIMEYKSKPLYDNCITISTKASLKFMILPGLLSIIPPVLIGFIFGGEVLGSFLIGLTVSGVLMATFQSNTGGAWDNVKKSFEKGVYVDGEFLKKGSDAHKASITGDTVGDPLKDTSGPSINILIKLSSIVSLIIAHFISI